jgi:lauroyl/myristoyl acyltransferase
MEMLIGAALLGLIPAAIAHSKGQNFAMWWIYGAAIFIVALPHALFIRPGAPQAVLASHGDRRPATSSLHAYAPHAAPPVSRDELRHWFGPR